ncbi:hypothetical protein DFH05DRAFT_1458424 [Lentinula detonsa]|uniref:Uncharacterized protein n=1 Tax=Lentinula detonsa TaxID=2804962 RepID=A0A9W8P315_9AGAR|nr:hypothetical protein DFH05DRAFT_1458424 [Lentinula detonsa]
MIEDPGSFLEFLTIFFFFIHPCHPYRLLARFKSPELHQCELVECAPFDPACSCNLQYFIQLSVLVNSCRLYLPFLSLPGLFVTANLFDFEIALDRHFQVGLSVPSGKRLYAEFNAQIKRLQDLCRILCNGSTIRSKFIPCTRRHRPLQSDAQALVVFNNLSLLLDSIRGKIVSLESDWRASLDRYPGNTEEMLRALMTELTGQ